MISPQKDNLILSSFVIDWYKSQGRASLPWRHNISPYSVWISEIMLQQTQVKTVIPYYLRFLKEHPTLESLFQATEDEVIALWSGLGFYRRARNIFKAKEIIKTEFNNQFPKNFDDLKALPGIGESTAGAIMSIAYQKSYPILDANVKRVLSRYSNINEQSPSKRDKQLWEVSREVTPMRGIFEYTQGIMDLGATLCKPSNPSCEECPVNSQCLSAFNVSAVKKNKKASVKKVIEMNLSLIQTKKSLLLAKNETDLIWKNLWLPFDSGSIKNHIRNFKLATTQKIKHELTHRTLEINLKTYSALKELEIETNQTYKWIKKDRIEQYGLPKPISKAIKEL